MTGAERVRYDADRKVIEVERAAGVTEYDEHRDLGTLSGNMDTDEWRAVCVALFERVGEWVEVTR